jgi:hypothetical protein
LSWSILNSGGKESFRISFFGRCFCWEIEDKAHGFIVEVVGMYSILGSFSMIFKGDSSIFRRNLGDSYTGNFRRGVNCRRISGIVG